MRNSTGGDEHDDGGSGGFVFSFDAPATAPRDAAPAACSASTPAWPPASTSMARFPWVSLDAATVHGWAAAAAAASESHNRSSKGRTRPLQLRLETRDTRHGAGEERGALELLRGGAGVQTITLCYQTPPEVEALTTVCSASTLKGATGVGSTTGTEHRDVIPGRYYGGLKVWSCAVLLAQHLTEHAADYRPLLTSAAAVMEVGCGQALPGLAALCLGARRVVLQDYNAEVLDVCTRPNVAATMQANSPAPGPTTAAPQVRLAHGDWVDLAWAADGDGDGGDAGCDVVLGADVTFDKEACDKLACALHRWLRPRTGTAIIASKDYYFGTNGGYLEFSKSAEAYGLCVSLVQRVDTADKMPHVILRVTHSADA